MKYVDKKYKGEYPLEAIYFSLNTAIDFIHNDIVKEE